MSDLQLPAIASAGQETAELGGLIQESPSPLSLRTNFAWTFAGNVVYAGCQWGMLIVLAKLGGPEMVGQFALGNAVSTPVFMFTNLQIRAVQSTDAKRQYSFSDYLGLRLITVLIAILVIVGLVAAAGYSRETALVVLVIGLAKAFEAMSDVFYGLQQQHERMNRIAISMMIKGVASLVALSAGVWLTGSVLWGTVGLAIVWALLLATYDVRSGMSTLRQTLANAPTRTLWPRWQTPIMLRLSWLTLPLGITMMLISLNTNIPRYFIEHYLGTRELGIFAAITYLMGVGNTLISALGQSASPRLAHYYATGDVAAFRSLIWRLIKLSATLGVLGVAVAVSAGREILILLYRPEYGEHVGEFICIMWAAAISYMALALGYGMTAAHYFKVQAPLFLVICILTTVACTAAIPSFGILGAALAMLLTAASQLVGSVLVILHALHRGQRQT